MPLTRPWMSFIFGGPSARPASVSIEYSLDTLSARAQVQFPGNTRLAPAYFPAVEINEHCWLQGGYRDANSAQSNFLLFDGWIEDDGSQYANTALENTIALGDRLRLLQYPVGDLFVQNQTRFNQAAIYDSTQAATIDPTTGVATITGPSATNNGVWTDVSIALDLFTRAGFGSGQTSGIGGQNALMAQLQGIVLTNQQTPADLLTRLDQATGCKTFATPNGVIRIPITYTPSTGAVWTLRQGFEILDIQNRRSTRKFYNRVIVLGLKQGGAQIISIRSAPANLPQVPGSSALQLLYGRLASQPITYQFSSDLIQSQDLADLVSDQLLRIGNRVESRYSITTAFTPQAIPGQTVAVYAPAAKIYSTTQAFLYGIKHTLDASGALSVWDVATYGGTSAPAAPTPPTVSVPDAQVVPLTNVDTP
jgi:hypothetical protein